MYSPKVLDLLVVALSLSTVTQASWVDVALLGRNEVAIEERAGPEVGQKLGVGVGAGPQSDAPTSPDATPTPPQTTTTTTAPAKTTSTTAQTTPSSTSATSTTPSSSSSESQSTSSTPSSTTPPPSSTSSGPQSSSSSSEQEERTSVYYVTATRSDGTPTTYTSQTVIPTGDLANSSGGSTSGMSSQTKSVIIGVVVGVGGAIVLAGLALIAWRIWGRKKTVEESDGLMSYGNGPEKSEVGTSAVGGPSRTPFQSTLESYHAPTQVNTASNF